MSDYATSRFGYGQAPDPLVYERIGQLEAENAVLRKRVRRYNRGSWVLGILLLLLWVLPAAYAAVTVLTAP
jgi:hypothetical protein